MQFKKISYDLISEKATVIERNRSSFFDIWIPKELCLGNNEIKLRLIKDDVFKKGSDILIELVDTENNPLYYSISEIANEDQSRSIIVKVTEENVNGRCQLRFLCKFVNNESYLCIINLEINNRIENNQNIKFQSEPAVTYTEHRALLQKTSQVNRKINKPNQSGLIFQKEIIHPRQLQQENIRIEKPEISNKTIVNNVNSNTGSGVFENIPTFTSPAVIHSIGYAFSSSMQFGIITIPELNYSASILNVINTGSIEVWPPYSGSYKNISNFTCSFNDSLTIINSELSQSYAIFELKNLNTNVGVVDSVDINYKVLNQIGTDYQPLGNYKVRNYNYLTDLNVLRFDSVDGIVEQAIGRFENTTQFNQYWESSSLLTIAKSDSVKNGILISGSNFNIKPRLRTDVNENDILEVYFDYFNHNGKQLDVYISGSKIEQLTEQKNVQNNPNQNLGSYLGSITERQGSFSSKFKVLNSSYIHPIFYFNSGSWSLGNIELRSVKIQGYTPSRTKIIAPLDFPSGSELNFKLIYVNPTGKRLNTIANEIKGVFFSGNTQLAGTGTTTPLPTGLVSGSDQLTGSYDTRYERKGTGILSSSQQIKNDISGSFTDISSSFQVRITNLENRSGSYVNTGSYNTDSGSWNTRITDLTTKTGSYATTGSNQFNGNQSISGSLTVSSSVSATNFTGIFNGQPSSSAQIKVLLPTGTISGSEQLTSSYDTRYERKGTGIVSSSTQIKVLLPTGTVSGSEQLTGSYDSRYHRLGTGLLSSSNQIATDISGSSTILSSSLATRITVFENKTLYSSSQQVDYNQLNNKPIIANVGNNRIITSDGTVSGSRANDRFEYISSSVDNRVRLRNDVNFEQGYSSSFWTTEWRFVSQSFFQFNQINRNKIVYIPLAFNNDTNAPITASLIHNSYAVEVKLHIYALTGSKSAPLNTYNWSSTTQFRILNNPKDSGATPLFSNIVVQSSSQYAGLGGYGTTFTGKADLNSWHYINSVGYNNSGYVEFGFGIAPTSSFFWDGYVAIVANVIKHEIRV